MIDLWCNPYVLRAASRCKIATAIIAWRGRSNHEIDAPMGALGLRPVGAASHNTQIRRRRKLMFTDLMTSRRFVPLFWCQFCSALNDNLLKNALVMLILFGLGGTGAAAGPYAPVLVTLAGVVLIAPFFVLSALGGELADRYDKARVAAYIKLAEIPMAGLAAVGFYLHSVAILFATLGLFGIVAALFGPVKYGILPEKLTTAELPAGNALVEGATFIAILAGTIAGGVAVTAVSTPEIVVGLILAFAVASWVFARAIPSAGPAAPNITITRNVWTSTFTLLRELKGDARLWAGGHITSWFWLVGSVALALLPSMVRDNLGGNEGVVTLGLTTFVIGIAAGSVLAARASHGAPNLALVPLGAVLIGICALVLGWLATSLSPSGAPMGPAAVLMSARGLAVLTSLCGLTIAGGLYMVPAMAAVQAWSPPERRARVIAAVNVMNAAYMLGGGAIVAGLQAAGVGPGILFSALGVLSFAAMLYALRAWGFALDGYLGRVMQRFSFARRESAEEPSGRA
jgi:acyl-[acyl-carrier-protein]-phospholipid O-acyltransferase / long-chain-fatty-acid--[acyl-carrier-protein] ligase